MGTTARPWPMAGFTILELVVVLFFMALISSIVLPNLTSAYNAWLTRLEVDDLILQIEDLNLISAKNAEMYILSKDTKLVDLPFEWPVKWRVVSNDKIIYYSNGVCGGGRLTIVNDGRKFDFMLKPPFCSVDRVYQ